MAINYSKHVGLTHNSQWISKFIGPHLFGITNVGSKFNFDEAKFMNEVFELKELGNPWIETLSLHKSITCFFLFYSFCSYILWFMLLRKCPDAPMAIGHHSNLIWWRKKLFNINSMATCKNMKKTKKSPFNWRAL